MKRKEHSKIAEEIIDFANRNHEETARKTHKSVTLAQIENHFRNHSTTHDISFNRSNLNLLFTELKELRDLFLEEKIVWVLSTGKKPDWFSLFTDEEQDFIINQAIHRIDTPPAIYDRVIFGQNTTSTELVVVNDEFITNSSNDLLDMACQNSLQGRINSAKIIEDRIKENQIALTKKLEDQRSQTAAVMRLAVTSMDKMNRDMLLGTLVEELDESNDA